MRSLQKDINFSPIDLHKYLFAGRKYFLFRNLSVDNLSICSHFRPQDSFMIESCVGGVIDDVPVSVV